LRELIGTSSLDLLSRHFFLRIPFLGYPAATVFDEGAYKTFLINDVNRIPYFEIHPPLARLMFASLLQSSEDISLTPRENEIGKPFGDFPYVPVRKFSLLFGTCIPALVYLLGRLIGIEKKYAFVAGAAATFDSLLIVYSRLILPDSILWFFCLLSIVCALFSARFRGWRQILLVSLCGFFVGLAFSVKWTGGIFGILAVIAFLVYVRPWWKILALSLIVFVISIASHLVVWGTYLNRFPGGAVDPTRSLYGDLANALVFPSSVTMPNVIEFAYTHTKTSIAVQKNQSLMDHVLAYGYPEKWPVGLDVMNVWQKKDNRKSIRFAGNFPVYILTALSVVSLIAMNLFRLLKKNKEEAEQEKTETFLLVSYMVCYLSVVGMAWSRPMFLYHYVPAYFFAVLMLAYCLWRLNTLSPESGKLALRAVTILIFVFFLLQSAYTYGY
jgi:dolichyl-phosphate-mannose--protein O-mannosyl transferase